MKIHLLRRGDCKRAVDGSLDGMRPLTEVYAFADKPRILLDERRIYLRSLVIETAPRGLRLTGLQMVAQLATGKSIESAVVDGSTLSKTSTTE